MGYGTYLDMPWKIIHWACYLGATTYLRSCHSERSGPGAVRTIPLFNTISASPPKQPRMVRTFLKVHTRPRLAHALRCRESSTNKKHHLSKRRPLRCNSSLR